MRLIEILWSFHVFSDDLANNLYWADTERSTVEVFSFNTHHRAVVQQFVGIETPITLIAVPET